MAEREHFSNGRTATFGTGFGLMSLAFGAQVSGWTHWITIGAGYGSGVILMLLSSLWITKSYYSRQSANDLPHQALTAANIVPRDLLVAGTTNNENFQKGIISAIFTPLQIDAFKLSADIARFLDSLGERPSQLNDGGPNTVTKQVQEEAFNVSQVIPWVRKLTCAYAEDFAPRVTSLLNRVGKEGIGDPYLRQHARRVRNETDLREVQRRVIRLAHGLDGIDVERAFHNEN